MLEAHLSGSLYVALIEAQALESMNSTYINKSKTGMMSQLLE